MIQAHAEKHIDTLRFPPNEGRSYDVVRGKYTKMAYGRLGGSWQNAEDAVQSTYLALLEYPVGSITEEDYEALFTTVLKGTISKMVRNERAREHNHTENSSKYVQYLEVEQSEEERDDNREEIIALPDELSNPEDKQIAEELLAFISSEINRLKFNHRQIVALNVLYGYKPREIHGITGDKVQNIWKVIQRFRDEMKEKL